MRDTWARAGILGLLAVTALTAADDKAWNIGPANHRALMDPPPCPSGGSGASCAPLTEPIWVDVLDFRPGTPYVPALIRSDTEAPPGEGVQRGTPGPAVNFTAVTATGAGSSIPPDTHIAVGPGAGAAGRIVMVTNDRVQIFNKTGAPVTAATPLTTMFGPGFGAMRFDPKILYDQHSNVLVYRRLQNPKGEGQGRTGAM